MATKRLVKDYMQLQLSPSPYIRAKPLDSDIFEWHYVIIGPEDSPFRGGIYHGTLEFSEHYPHIGPYIFMHTPNGRFYCDKMICIPGSAYNNQRSTVWTANGILESLLQFMMTDGQTFGAINCFDSTHVRQLAKQSCKFNSNNDIFCKLFPDLVDQKKECFVRVMLTNFMENLLLFRDNIKKNLFYCL